MTRTDAWQGIADLGLRYFGAVSASVSHDIRNRLAVINEKAGLLEDLATMILEGRAVDPERLRMQARKVRDQVELTNRIIHDLNTFAHSVDVPLVSVDVVELLTLVANLSARKAAMANAAIDTSGLSGTIALTTRPFFLGTLVAHCLDVALEHIDDGRTISITADSGDDGVVIHFGHVTAPDGVAGPPDPRGAVVALLELLGGRITVDGEHSELLLEVSDLGKDGNGGQP